MQPAYVLHRRPYRETSAILDVFGLETGRFSCIARGVQNSRKGRNALLQPFQPLRATFAGSGNLLTLAAVESAAPAFALKGQPLFCAYYLNELLLYLLPEREENLLLFADYGSALSALQRHEPEGVLRRFELRLLRAVGLAPDLERDAGQQVIAPGRRYRRESEGYFSATHGDEGSIGTEQGMAWQSARGQRAVDGASLLALHALAAEEHDENSAAAEFASWLPVQRRDAKNLMRALIDHALHGRTLNSRAFFASGAAREVK